MKHRTLPQSPISILVLSYGRTEKERNAEGKVFRTLRTLTYQESNMWITILTNTSLPNIIRQTPRITVLQSHSFLEYIGMTLSIIHKRFDYLMLTSWHGISVGWIVARFLGTSGLFLQTAPPPKIHIPKALHKNKHMIMAFVHTWNTWHAQKYIQISLKTIHALPHTKLVTLNQTLQRHFFTSLNSR